MTAVIEFKGYRILEVNYRFLGNENLNKETLSENSEISNDFQFGLNESFTEGQVIINVNVTDKINSRKISASVEGQFKINKDELDGDEERIKEILSLNGTSILFPYVRSILSMITSLDSPNAIVIPTVNVFEALNQEDEKTE